MANEEGDDAGKAYGFFYCGASKQEIEQRLPTLRQHAETPSQLELSLIEGMDNVRGDSKLTALAQQAKREGINYMLQATYPSGTNRNAADEVATIFGLLSHTSLYGTEEQFKGEIIYKEERNYVFRN